MKKKKSRNYSVAKGPEEIAMLLGIESEVEVSLIKMKAQLSEMAAKAITKSGLTVNELVKRSGVARSKVSAIKNGALAGISSDLFLKVIMASGSKINLKLVS